MALEVGGLSSPTSTMADMTLPLSTTSLPSNIHNIRMIRAGHSKGPRLSNHFSSSPCDIMETSDNSTGGVRWCPYPNSRAAAWAERFGREAPTLSDDIIIASCLADLGLCPYPKLDGTVTLPVQEESIPPKGGLILPSSYKGKGVWDGQELYPLLDDIHLAHSCPYWEDDTESPLPSIMTGEYFCR